MLMLMALLAQFLFSRAQLDECSKDYFRIQFFIIAIFFLALIKFIFELILILRSSRGFRGNNNNKMCNALNYHFQVAVRYAVHICIQVINLINIIVVYMSEFNPNRQYMQFL